MLRSFRSRLILASLLAFTVMLAVLQWNAQRQLTHALESVVAGQSELIGPLATAAIAPLVATRDYATLQELVQRSVGPLGLAELVVLDRRGQRLAQAGAEGPGHVIVLPLDLAGQRYGEVRARMHDELAARTRSELQRDGMLLGGAVLAGGALLLALVVTLLGRDLERMAGASTRIAAGELDVQVPVQGATEVRQLAEAFNTMSRAVRGQLEALRDREQRLQSVVAAMSEGLLVLDQAGRLVDCNEAAARLLGRTREDLLTDSTAIPRSPLITPEGRTLERAERPAWRALATGEPQRVPLIQVQRPDGSRSWLQIASEPVPGPDGRKPAYVVSTLTDISDRVAAEATLRAANLSLEQRVAERTQALRQALDQAEQASRAKSEFLSRMSHELRTPLNAILGFAQLMAMSRSGQDDADRHRVQQIELAGWHLLALIDDVLDLSRIEAGAMTVSLEPVAPSEVAAQALQMASTQAHRQGVTLEPWADGVPWVRADRRRLLQVLGNLLSNGIKYNRSGGRVSLRWRADATEVRLEVADTGRGMSADQLGRLFVPFTRFDAGAVDGTGIGLVITRRLVELMGGRMEVESTVGAGSRFTVVLARSEPAERPAPPAAEAPAGPGPALGPRRIVYVEDNPSNRHLMAEVLALRPGLQLETAVDGLEGLALLQRPPLPDLALIDIDLPGLDGLALCRRVKAEPALARLPLMAVTAQAMKGDLERMHAAGFDAVVTKPLDVQRLLDQIDQLLEAPPLKRRTLIAAGLATALPGPALQAQETPLRLGLTPFLSASALLEMFRPVVDHLQRQVGRPVEAYTSRDFQALTASLRGGEYDLALVPSHLGRLAVSDWRWLPLARAFVATPVLVVVRGSGPVRTAADLRGRPVGTLDLLSLTSAVGARWLAQQQLPESSVTPMPSINSALIALERDELGAVVVNVGQMQSLPPATPGGQRTLARIDDVPGPVYLARPGTAPELVLRLRDALTSLVPDASRPPTPANARPFPLAAADLDAMEPHAAYLRVQLAGR